MLILRLMIAMIPIHLGLGFTQVAVSYYAGDYADYGAAGLISHTPIGSFVNLDDMPEQTEEGMLSNVRDLFDTAVNAGVAINGLASFGYGFLQQIQPDDGLVYLVVMTLRTISALMWIASGFALVVAGGGVAGLAALGAAVGG